jgi:hypothetical protein
MKYLGLLRVMALFGIANSILFAGRVAPALDGAPMGARKAGSESAGTANKLQDTQPAPLAAVNVAAQEADKPMADASNQDQVVSMSEIISTLEVSFSQQRSDAEWSHRAEQQVRKLFLPVTSKDTSLFSVQCRTTLCRVVFLHATEAEFQQFLNTIKTDGLTPAWKGQVVGGRVAINQDGKVRSVFYLAKEGTTVPLQPAIGVGAGDGKNSSKR